MHYFYYLKKSEMKYLLTEVNFFILSLLIILSIISIIKSDNAQCSKKQTCEESAEKYKIDLNNPKWEQIKENIETAFVEYTPCNNTNCKCHVSVIKNDLKQFKDGITKDMIKLANKLGTKYQIINHQLYRDKECMFPSRCSGIEHFLLKLAPKLPNIEFIVNTRDWPQILKYNKPLPVFSFSKTSDYFDIIYPAWSFWEGGPAISLYPTGIGRWDEHRKKLTKISKEISWEDKIPKAFFRGSRTSPERDPLVLLSREFPDLVDAQYTKNQAWKSSADTLNAEPAKEVPFEDHCKYRYLFNFRGVAASFRLKHLFLCKSLVFHVGDEWIEFFYPAMKPWIHYIPVKNKASKEELRNLIHFVIHNDKLIRKIAEHGYEFIWNNLKMNDVICYWNRLLKHYAKLLKYEPVLDESLVRIYNK